MDTPPKVKKTWKNGSDKAAIFQALRAADYPITDAARKANLTPRQGFNIEKIRKIGEDKTFHNIARRGIKQLAKGLTFGELKEVKDSTVVAACSVILDRTEPKIVRQDIRSLSVTLTAEQLDRVDQMFKQLTNQPQDAAPQLTSDEHNSGSKS
ncbi:MAG: hypothetical protein WA066_02760 [Candidatus Omnitrophota bacterium]